MSTTTVADRPATVGEPPAPTTGATIDLGRVTALAVALVGVGIGASRLSDNSFLTHLATGRHIVDHGFPREEVFTWTGAGESIVLQSWLASTLYGLVDAMAGFHGLRLLMAATAGVLAWLAWRLTARSTSLLTRVAIVVPVLFIGMRTWTERPLLLGLVLLALTLLIAEGEGRLTWLALIGALWVGIHGSWPLGLVLLAARAVGAKLDGDDPGRELRALGWLGAGILVGGVVNPYGPALLTFPLDLLGRQETLSNVAEWKAPDYQSTWTQVFLVLAIASVVAAARRMTWRTLVPGLIFLAAALMSRRNIPLASLVLLPVLATGLPAIGVLAHERSSDAIRLAGRALIVLLVALPLVAVRAPHIDTARYPVEAIDVMEDEGLSPQVVRSVHPDFVGNYLDLRYGDAGATWIDDRFELHATELVEDYLTLLEGEAGWADVLERYAAEALVWPTDAPLVELAREVGEWQVIWADDDWTVLCHPAAC